MARNSESHKASQAKYYASHKQEKAARRLAKVASWKASGLCSGCGKSAPASGKARCAKCNSDSREKAARGADRRHQQHRERYLARVAAGMCVECGKPAFDGMTKCEKHLAAQRVRSIEFGKRNPIRKRATWIKHRYGLTLDEWASLLESQGGRCAICRAEDPGKQKNWHVDHDHDTGTIRGMLCGPCNIMLGMAKDNENTLLEAVTYLRKHSAKPKESASAA